MSLSMWTEAAQCCSESTLVSCVEGATTTASQHASWVMNGCVIHGKWCAAHVCKQADSHQHKHAGSRAHQWLLCTDEKRARHKAQHNCTLSLNATTLEMDSGYDAMDGYTLVIFLHQNTCVNCAFQISLQTQFVSVSLAQGGIILSLIRWICHQFASHKFSLWTLEVISVGKWEWQA